MWSSTPRVVRCGAAIGPVSGQNRTDRQRPQIVENDPIRTFEPTFRSHGRRWCHTVCLDQTHLVGTYLLGWLNAEPGQVKRRQEHYSVRRVATTRPPITALLPVAPSGKSLMATLQATYHPFMLIRAPKQKLAHRVSDGDSTIRPSFPGGARGRTAPQVEHRRFGAAQLPRHRAATQRALPWSTSRPD